MKHLLFSRNNFLANVKLTASTSMLLISTIGLFSQTAIGKLEVNGAAVTSATIAFGAPKQQPVSQEVRLNQSFVSGTLFIVPAKTVVWLVSNGNRQRLGPGSKHVAYSSSKGESHRTFWGSVTHFVSNRLNFYKASGPSTKHQGAVKGTVFTVEAVGKDVKFSTQEGIVSIENEVNISIEEQSDPVAGKARNLTTTQTELLSAGDPEKFYAHGANEEIRYASYEEAIATFSNELDQAYSNGIDAALIAEKYTLLGELYLDDGNPGSASDAFKTSIELYEEKLEPDDPLVAQNYIGLGEASYDLGNYEVGTTYCNNALNIVSEDLQYNLEDFEYFKSIGDYDSAWGIGIDVMDNYEDLGWCYELLSDPEESDRYYAMADALESELSQY